MPVLLKHHHKTTWETRLLTGLDIQRCPVNSTGFARENSLHHQVDTTSQHHLQHRARTFDADLTDAHVHITRYLPLCCSRPHEPPRTSSTTSTGTSPATDRIVFTLEGASHEIDLSTDHTRQLPTTLMPDHRIIRRWALTHGHTVPATGRISPTVLHAHQAAHPPQLMEHRGPRAPGRVREGCTGSVRED
jgi:hypothetical protein